MSDEKEIPMTYTYAYNEITIRAIKAVAAGTQIDAGTQIEGETSELLRALYEENCRWIDGTARLIAIGLIAEDEGQNRTRILSEIGAFLRSRAEAIGCEHELASAEDPGELPREDPMAAALPAAARLIDFQPVKCKVVGQIDGGRKVLGKITERGSESKIPIVLCRCSCGNYFLARAETVLRGWAHYCGPDCPDRPQPKGKDPKLYEAWKNMIRRCTSPSHDDWDRYGGRGIRVCPEWLDDFRAFEDWALNSGYRRGLTLERINNDGDYTPANCTWSTMKEQSNNRSTCIYVVYEGQRMTLKQAATASGISYGALRYRYHTHGETGLFAPVQRSRR